MVEVLQATGPALLALAVVALCAYAVWESLHWPSEPEPPAPLWRSEDAWSGVPPRPERKAA